MSPERISISPNRDWGHRMLSCDPTRSRIIRDSKSLQLDSGGWAKGLAAQRAAHAAIMNGAAVAQVSCGGDIFRAEASGLSYWKCAIRDPSRGRYDIALQVRHRFPTVATSGNTEIYRFSQSGMKIGHLMDPRTGKSAQSDLLSISVFGHDGLSTDAASSALFVMGKNDAIQWLTANPDFGAILIDHSWPRSAEGMTLVGALEPI
jgi:thiamine biosynthesis lipoprotein